MNKKITKAQNDKRILKEHKMYWKEVNYLIGYCEDLIQNPLYTDDVISILDRVKTHWLQEKSHAQLLSSEEFKEAVKEKEE